MRRVAAPVAAPAVAASPLVGDRLRRLDDRLVGPATRPSARSLVLALLAGLVAAGVPAAYVVAVGGPVLVAALLPLLALVPVGLLLASG